MKDKVINYLEVELNALNAAKRYYDIMVEHTSSRDMEQYYINLSNITQAKIDITKKHIKDIQYF